MCDFRNLKWLFLSILLMLLDVGVKYWIRTHFSVGEVLFILPGINFCCVYNSGIAFGWLSDVYKYYWFLMGIGIFIIFLFVLMLCQSIDSFKYHNLSYSMIIGGGLGNLLDRALYGSVVDFIDFHVGIWHWPSFNIADVMVCLGVMILLIYYCGSYLKK